MRFLRHFTVVAALLLLARAGVSAQVPAGNTFRVFIRGADSGVEEVTLLESAEGWTLRGSVKMRAPINVAIDSWEARYDRNWRPIELTVNVTEETSQRTLRTTLKGPVASIDISQNGQVERRTATVTPDAIVLPGLVFGAYEALAAKLATSRTGEEIPALIAENAVTITVNNVTQETVQTPGRTISARRWMLHLRGDTAKIDMAMELWTDGSRLLRIDIPSRVMSVVRDDVASVSARLVTMSRANDESVSIAANGFSLAATISKPASTPARVPAIILVSGSAATDRDEMASGIPIFAQLADGFANDGFLVVRYDERGVGQSGGRAESATLDEFALDARAVVTYVSKRKDVDPKRISIVGYGEGGWVALLAAAAEKRVAALTLIATPALSGSELVLEQQRAFLQRSGTSGPEQRSAVERQKAILAAVITGKGWENITLDVRRRTDTPLYRSILTFEPARVLARIRQPVLVVQPALDREVGAHHGEQLLQLARSRPRAPVTEFLQLPSANHLLARAGTGEVDEYGALPEKRVIPEAIREISGWLKRALHAGPVE